MQSLTHSNAVLKEHYAGGKEKVMEADNRPLGKGETPSYRKKTSEVRSAAYKRNPGQLERKTVARMLGKGRRTQEAHGQKWESEPLTPGHAGA